MMMHINKPSDQWNITLNHGNSPKGRRRVLLTDMEVLVGEVEVRKHTWSDGHSKEVRKQTKGSEWQHVAAALTAGRKVLFTAAISAHKNDLTPDIMLGDVCTLVYIIPNIYALCKAIL